MTMGPPASDLAVGLAAVHAEAFDCPWTAPAFDDLLKQSGMILEVKGDGFVLIQVAADQAEILTLAVRPAARRRGVATALVKTAARRAELAGAGRLFLEVAEDNFAARALYGRLGFASVGRRPRYYARPAGPPVDALLLALNLDARLPSA